MSGKAIAALSPYILEALNLAAAAMRVISATNPADQDLRDLRNAFRRSQKLQEDSLHALDQIIARRRSEHP